MLGSSAVVFPLWIAVAFHAVLFDSVLEVSVSLQVRRELFPISPYVLNEVRFPRIVGEIDGKPHRVVWAGFNDHEVRADLPQLSDRIARDLNSSGARDAPVLDSV